jgi:hypothetical protein
MTLSPGFLDVAGPVRGWRVVNVGNNANKFEKPKHGKGVAVFQIYLNLFSPLKGDPPSTP